MSTDEEKEYERFRSRGQVLFSNDPRWDKELPTCTGRIPKRVLRHMAFKCLDEANRSGEGKSLTMPGIGTAGDSLHGMLYMAMEDEGWPKDGPRIAASMLMGLAEEGAFVP